MERIIEDVLWLARNGREIGEAKPVAVKSVVDSAWELIVDTDSNPSLDFTGSEPPGSRLVADRDRLRQLLENIFANAVEHAGPAVEVRVELSEGELAIADDGKGIPPENRSDIFETGYSTTRDGTGFGLRIVDQVVDAHGWELTVTESAEGGARFEISGLDIRPPAE
jgi:signal transduction histidine kinase